MTDNIPDDLKLNPSRRGPAGTELMGVSVAIPLSETMSETTKTVWSQEEWREFLRVSQPQLLDMLRKHVGGARFQTEPQFNLDGPHPDPLQGPIYVMTAAAWFRPEDLAVDCPAYLARSKR